jgi:hypothetical protein
MEINMDEKNIYNPDYNCGKNLSALNTALRERCEVIEKLNQNLATISRPDPKEIFMEVNSPRGDCANCGETDCYSCDMNEATYKRELAYFYPEIPPADSVKGCYTCPNAACPFLENEESCPMFCGKTGN